MSHRLVGILYLLIFAAMIVVAIGAWFVDGRIGFINALLFVVGRVLNHRYFNEASERDA